MTTSTRSLVASLCVVAAVALSTAGTRATPQKFAVGGGPEAVAFDGSYLWVTSQFDDTVTKMTADGSVIGVYAVGEQPLGVATDGRSVWVANHGSNTVSRLDAADGRLLATFDVGQGPGGLAYAEGFLLVANRTSNNVMKLQAANGVLEWTTKVGKRPMGVAISTTAAGAGTNSFIWITNNQDKTVTKLRPNGAVAGTFAVGDGPFGAVFDGASIWVSNFFSGNVMRLGIDGTVQATYPTGDGASGILFDGSNIWVANHGDDNLTRLRASDGALLETMDIGEGPFGVSSDGTNIWVSNFTSDEVARLANVVAPPLGTAGLVLALGFNETGGTTAFDASPARNTGIIGGGAGRTPGREGAGSALVLDGVNDVVSVAGTPSLDLREAATVEAWIRPNSLTGAAADKWRSIVTKQGDSGLSYALYANEALTSRPAAIVDIAGVRRSAAAGPAVAPSAWTHLAMTFENGMLRIYVNGVERKSAAFTGVIAATPGAPLRIGGNSVWGEFFSGQIDDVRVYKRALSVAEIATDMGSPVP
jgi:YVTN family beta-propeller protein